MIHSWFEGQHNWNHTFALSLTWPFEVLKCVMAAAEE